MILADKIIMLRKKNGWSQEELAEKLNVSRQSVSKWESGLSVPDLNKIVGMSALFGVSTDYLLKDTLEEITPSESAATDDAEPVRAVSLAAAIRYMESVERLSIRIAIGIMLCILSPMCLVLLGGFAGEGVVWLPSEGLAVGIGMVVLFLLVGAAVAIFIPTGMKLSEFSYLDRERFLLEYGAEGIVEKKRAAYEPRYRTLVTLGVMMCIFSAIPLVVFGAMNASAIILIACTALILLICSIAVALIVRASYVNGSYLRLLQRGEFSEESKQQTKKKETLESAFWALVTAIYLGSSFLSGAWHITWIIWPVAACLFPALELLIKTMKNK